jgi:hypothetical protein
MLTENYYIWIDVMLNTKLLNILKASILSNEKGIF